MAETRDILVGWLIDGTGAPARKRMVLQVRGGVIVAVTPVHGEAPGDVQDLSWATVAPPFIDSHVHLAMTGAVDEAVRSRQLAADCDELLPVIDRHVRDLFAHGILAVRDGGDRHSCVQRFVEERDDLPIRIVTPGPAWCREGRYGRLIGTALAEGKDLATAWEGDGYDLVKLVNSGLNSLKEYGRTTRKQFGREEIAALVARAARSGKRVMVHANGVEAVWEAVEGGCHSIEHGFFMGRENLERMAERGVVWVPTAVTMQQYAEVMMDGGDRAGADVARRNLAHQLEQIRLARELGVTVACGTDAGSPGVLHGQSFFEEMKLLIKGGFTLEEAVQSATAIGARLLGGAGSGTLEIGQPADFLVARGIPAQLPRKFAYLEAIYRAGRQDDRYRKHPRWHDS